MRNRAPSRDNGAMSEVAVKPTAPAGAGSGSSPCSRSGLFALGYAIVEHLDPGGRATDSSMSPGSKRRSGLFGGMPQEGDRLGSDDAPVTIQVFNDLQCGNCRDDFLATIPALAERYARPGDVKLLYRHYSNSDKPEQLGFYGAEAAADQGYGWQYIYLFFRNQDEAERFGVDQDFLDSIAGSVEELELARMG